MLRNGSRTRLPLWVYGAIAALLIVLLFVLWRRSDTLERAELLVPAMFWTAAFIIIALRRRAARS